MSVARTRWVWRLIQLSRQIWFRTTFFALLSVAAALLAIPLGPLIPHGLPDRLGADTVSNVLEILASSMLVVATFSLSTVISAYAAASSGTTPRVTELLLQDPTAQNALATFLGGFLFGLVGIIGLSTGVYGSEGHVVLFAMTVVVVVIIVATFLHWVHVLSNFGRIPDAIDRTARVAADAVSDRAARPFLGGRAAAGAPETRWRLCAPHMGYVRHVDMQALQALAEKRDGVVRLVAQPGTFLSDDRAVAATDFEPDEDCRDALLSAFDIGDNRTFDQDPRYGISALAEIGIKALSPAVNDPVTAIRVIDRLVSVLSGLGNAPAPPEPGFGRVYVPALEPDAVFDEAFSGLALHGAGDVRVAVRLQKACASLARVEDPAWSEAARRQATLALGRAKSMLTLDDDRQRVEAAAAD